MVLSSLPQMKQVRGFQNAEEFLSEYIGGKAYFVAAR
jgi:hypothetical protein